MRTAESWWVAMTGKGPIVKSDVVALLEEVQRDALEDARRACRSSVPNARGATPTWTACRNACADLVEACKP